MTKKTRQSIGPHAQRIRRERGKAGAEPPGGSGPSDPKKDDWFEDFLTPDEMRQWAQREMREAARALDLRSRELLDLVDAYSSGKITAEKADELQSRYVHRWDEALPGVVQGDVGDPPLSDAKIIALMDESNPEQFIVPRQAHDYSRSARITPDGKKTR